ncbi:MAG TPA: redox-sensing transcriptional repressor Rex [Gemmatimonas aurantiaca]|uniref:Redox-sensing transcriptional repressor Rex n=2 Tax=Gemmatimonas aurantiaca TaxID=173480 RepID=C1A498_GEMAT|nr:redox-sensing transcriptional repressor Rex [Gemmatimonas aurantiaca T-27]HCT57191.1 redox-sensing transcriptional repressor Rex [Gemmatimonas aurantiaca]
MKRIADSTVRRLSMYLRYLEDLDTRGQQTASSDELAHLCGTTPAQVRKDLSFFGSFGKRGLGYPVHELTAHLREILGLQREWKVIIVGAGKIGAALANYRGFRQRGFTVVGVYDHDPAKVGKAWGDATIRSMDTLAQDIQREEAPIAVLAIPAENAQAVVDQIVAAGIRAILNFAPTQISVPPHVSLKSVNMAMELEGLSFALTNAGLLDQGAA